MTHRRADRVAFPTSRRAVCLEMEVAVVKTKIDDGIRRLIKIAEDQGWTVRMASSVGRLKWYDVDGKLRTSTPVGAHGRTLANIRSQLKRAGLNLDGSSPEANEQTYEVEIEEDVITPEQALEVLMEHFTSAPTVDLHQIEALRDQVEAWKSSSEEFSRQMNKEHARANELQHALAKSTEREQALRKQVADQAALLQSLGDAFELPITQVLGRLADLLGVKV